MRCAVRRARDSPRLQRDVALRFPLAYENRMTEIHAGEEPRPSEGRSSVGPAVGGLGTDELEQAAPMPAETDSAGDKGPSGAATGSSRRSSFRFFGSVAALCLLADVLTKAWAEVELTKRSAFEPMVLIKDHLNFALAYNRGGAWGLLQNASESVRRPFFLVVSVAAIAFIVSLYGKLLPTQRALRWGLPLVLGGALGNLADRVTRGSVVDFIDYRAEWVQSMNELLAKLINGWHVTDHWPTFNVADVSICIGVGLMAVDMLTSSRRKADGRGATLASTQQTTE